MTAERRNTADPVAEPAISDAELSEMLRQYMDVTGKLQQTHERLQQEIVRLRSELASKDRELELRRRLAALGELAAGVAHEVRNPLGAIQLYSGLLRSECRSHALGDAEVLVEKIETGIQAIEAVVQDTLALAPRDRKLGVCRLADVVQRAGDAAQKVLTERETNLDVCVGDAELGVRADSNGLQRVLVNLIANAAEAAPARSTVWVAVRQGERGMAEIRVADEGPGLSDEIRHRIFDPFFTTKQTGTGLGLTIAHRLIEAYGGELHADNRAEGGAEFVIALPAVAASEASAAPQQDDKRTSAA